MPFTANHRLAESVNKLMTSMEVADHHIEHQLAAVQDHIKVRYGVRCTGHTVRSILEGSSPSVWCFMPVPREFVHHRNLTTDHSTGHSRYSHYLLDLTVASRSPLYPTQNLIGKINSREDKSESRIENLEALVKKVRTAANGQPECGLLCVRGCER